MTQETGNSILLDTLLAAAVDAVFVADARGRITRVNPAACLMFGYGSEELTGASIDLLVPGGTPVSHADLIARYLETGESRIIGVGRDLDALRKDGSIFPIHLSVGRSDINGEPVFVGILHDLTARRASQRAVETAKRMEALGQLTGGIAHDFNNILTIIIGNLELLAPLLNGKDHHALLDEAMSAAELGSELIGKLLAHGRRDRLRPVRFDPNAAVTEALSLLRRLLSPKIRIRPMLRPRVRNVCIDRAGFENALINLLVNARDAFEGEGEIVISTSDVRIDEYVAEEIGIRPGDYVRVSVTDDGMGMPPEVRSRVFEPFFTTKKQGRGTGLGLATVYGFARQSGGNVTIYSEVGLGTTVSLYFPAVEAGAKRAETDPPAATVEESPKDQTILVVEDDAAIRHLSVRRVGALGYRAIAVADATEAIEAIRQNPEITAVFSDVVMPGPMSGLDLARQLRDERPDLAVLLTSGFSGDLFPSGGKGETGFHLLQKPYRQEELATRLHFLFSRRGS